MPYGYGFRGGWGFGFRGSSPPWPYVGLGRGGLPRCWHPGLWDYPQAPYSPHATPWATPYYGAGSYTPLMTKEQELDFLKREAQAVKDELQKIEQHIQDLEQKGE